MNRKVLLRSPAVVRPKSLPNDEIIDAPREKGRLAEVAGGSAAECTAICCCCPWTVLNILIFAVYRIPAGLCRKAQRKRRRKMNKKYLIQQQQQQQRKAASLDFTDGTVGPAVEGSEAHKPANDVADGDDMKKLEEEMWCRFNQTGFWRSSSQRHE